MDEQLTERIKELEVELLQPEVRRSAAKLNELLAENFCEFGGSGNRYTKKGIIEMLPKLEPIKYQIHDFQTLELSSHAVLATYRIETETLFTGVKRESLRSSIWQNIDGNLQLIFHQGTLIIDEP